MSFALVADPGGPRVVARAIFCDPGPTWSAYAFLEAMSDGRIEVRGAWYVHHNAVWLINTLLLMGEGVYHADVLKPGVVPGLFGMEAINPAIIFRGRKPSDLMATKRVEGAIISVAQSRGVTTRELAASEWREQLINSGCASNPQIACAVEGLFTNATTGKLELPPTTSHEREHCYDAIGGGIILLARFLAYPCPLLPEPMARELARRLRFPGGLLPKAIAEKIARIQLAEKAERSRKRFAKTSGLPVEKKPRRRPTRARAAAAQIQAEITRATNRRPWRR